MVFRYSDMLLVFFIYTSSLLSISCKRNNIRNTDYRKNEQTMNNTGIDTKKMKLLETFRIELKSRGALGLQLLFKTDKDSIVEVKRIETKVNNSNSILPGDPISAVFEIRSIKKGAVKITFYETQPWNKEFKEIIQKEIYVEVTE